MVVWLVVDGSIVILWKLKEIVSMWAGVLISEWVCVLQSYIT